MVREKTMNRFWELLVVLTEKELVLRYKKTLFGFYWAVLNSLVQMLVMGFIFTFFIKEKVDNYYSFLLCGLVIWMFFSVCLSSLITCVVDNRNLVKKANFLYVAIPFSIISANLVILLFTMVPLTILTTIEKSLNLGGIIYLLLGIIMLLLFTLGIGLFVSALNVFYRDVGFLVQAILGIWFYATPVFYSLKMIPEKYVWLWGLNPLVSTIELFRKFFVGVEVTSIPVLIMNMVVTVVFLVVGFKVYILSSYSFDDYL